jgi:hypothetical protein
VYAVSVCKPELIQKGPEAVITADGEAVTDIDTVELAEQPNPLVTL